ncbi:MAG: hypothetical protein ACRC0X_01840, partial [Brevinema sp.]
MQAKRRKQNSKLKQLESFGEKVYCPYCTSHRVYGGILKDKDYHCGSCNRNFTLYTGTKIHGK